MKNTKTTKAQAQVELIEALKVVEDLSCKLGKQQYFRERAYKALKLLGFVLKK